MTVVFFDLETTGLSTKTDQITQIAAKTRCGTKKFITYVNCSKEISAGSSRVTGITRDTVKDAPQTKVVLEEFIKWLSQMEKPVTLVAQNGERFDFPVLIAECIHNGIPVTDLPIDNFFDSLVWCRYYYKAHEMIMDPITKRQSYKLGNIYKVVTGKDLDGAHDAMIDVDATITVCKPCDDYFGVGSISVSDAIEKHKRALFGMELKITSKSRMSNIRSGTIMDFLNKTKR